MANGPLSVLLDTTAATTSVPMFSEGAMVEFKLTSLTQETTDKGNTFKWVFDSTHPAPNTDGGTINPGEFGSKVWKTMYAYGKDGPEAAAARIVTDVSRLLDALLGTGSPGNPKGKPSRPGFFDSNAAAQGRIEMDPGIVPQLLGKTLTAKIKNEKGDYERSGLGQVFFTPDLKK